MTNENALKVLRNELDVSESKETKEALHKAIQALIIRIADERKDIH